MIKPTFEVLNQRGTPMFFSDTLANRPAAAIVGRIFISTDTNEIYRDTGTAWNLLGGGGGTIGGSITTGQVAFGSAANTIAGTNNLFWDNSNARLGVGTNTPQTNIQISDNKNGITSLQISNTTAGLVSQSGIRLDSDASAGTMNLGKYSSTSSTYLSILANDGYLSNANFGDITLQNEVVTGRIKFSAGGVSTPQMTIFSTGNVGIGGGLTDSGQKLQINGTSIFGGNMTLSLNQNGGTILNVSNTTNATGSYSEVSCTASNGYFAIAKYSASRSSYKIFNANDGLIYNSGASGDIAILNDFATGRIRFAPGGSSTAQMTLQSNGNLLLGSVTDSGQRFQVTGDTLLKGSGNTNATIGLTIQNSDGTIGFRFFNGTTSTAAFRTIVVNNTANTGVSGLQLTENQIFFVQTGNIFYDITSGSGANSGGVQLRSANTLNPTTNNPKDLSINSTFAPTSGTATYISEQIVPIINQTGGANGITRALYVNPTLTAAADWRSIEWSNNSGFGLYGVGTALNYLNGNLLLGSTTNSATNERLQITGTQITTDTRTYSTGTIFTLTNVRNTTIPSGATISGGSGIINFISSGTNTFEGSVTVPATTTYSNIVSNNIYSITSAGATITSTQATGTRAISQQFIQNIFAGTSSGTFTHLSSMQISGFFNQATGSITPTITNAYQLLINDINDFGHTFTLTNRWGIYQEGSSDRNYLAGNLLLGNTTDTGERLQATGTAKITSKLSMGAGTTSNAQINLASSTAPTSPNDGDIWFDGTNLFMRIGGVTKTFTII